MSDVEHGLHCHSVRLNNLKLFFLARGHSADEAHEYATRHMQGENTPINEVVETSDLLAQPSIPRLTIWFRIKRLRFLHWLKK